MSNHGFVELKDNKNDLDLDIDQQPQAIEKFDEEGEGLVSSFDNQDSSNLKKFDAMSYESFELDSVSEKLTMIADVLQRPPVFISLILVTILMLISYEYGSMCRQMDLMEQHLKKVQKRENDLVK